MESSIKINSTKKVNFIGINYIKAIACISVLLVHFRLNVEHKIIASHFDISSAIFMQTDYELFVVCVPLFFMATGFLMLNKRASYQYYLKFGNTLLIYIVCSILTFIVLFIFKHESISLSTFIKEVITFKFIGYAWYVKTYMILYLMIPFLNWIVRKFKNSEKAFIVLILVSMLVVGVKPLLISGFDFSNTGLLHLWKFTILYPGVYYLLGAYIRTFNPKVATKWLVIIGLLDFVVMFYLNMINLTPYTSNAEGYYQSILMMIQAVVTFLFIDKIFTKESKIVNFISKRTLPIYLMTFCIDQIVYPFYINHVASPKDLFPFILLIVFFNFIISIFFTLIVEKVVNLIWPPIYNFLAKFDKIADKIMIEPN